MSALWEPVSDTPAALLTDILTVDGAGSGLDADLLDGQHASAFAPAGHTHTDEDGFFTLDGGCWDDADLCIGRVDGGTWDTPAEWS